MDRKVGVAVAGAGGAAQVVHLPILKRLPDVEVVGIVDLQVEKARTIAERFNISETARELGELESLEDVGAVLVCTPNATHEEVVAAALEAGKHVLCERPVATTSEAARRMLDRAEEAGRHLMVAMNHRFQLDVRNVRQFVASGELGESFFVRSSLLHQRERRPRQGWRRDPDLSGGGVLMDLGVQAVDLALWILGYPAVERIATRVHRRTDVEESAVLLMAVEGGASVSVEVSWELMEESDRHSLYVLGTSGSAHTPPLRVLKEMETGLSDVTPPLDVSQGNLYTASYRQEWAEFLRRVRGEVEAEPQEEQVELMRVIEACYRSAREGREVEPS